MSSSSGDADPGSVEVTKVWALQRLNISGEVYELCSGATVVGRSPIASITLSSSTVSRLHCRFSVSNDSRDIFVEDLNSGNGTYVNRKKIISKSPFTLNLNDEIGIGTSDNSHLDVLEPEDHYHFKLIKLFKKPKQRPHDFIDLTDVTADVEDDSDFEPEKETDNQIIENENSYSIFCDDISEGDGTIEEHDNVYDLKTETEVIEEEAVKTLNDEDSLPNTVNEPRQTAINSDGIELIDSPDLESKDIAVIDVDEDEEPNSAFKPPAPSLNFVDVGISNSIKRKHLVKERGLSQQNENFKYIINKRPRLVPLTNESEIKFNFTVSNSNSIVLGHVLFWSPKWLKQYRNSVKIAPIQKGVSDVIKLKQAYGSYDGYKPVYTHVVCLLIWNSMMKGYIDLDNSTTTVYSCILLHPLKNISGDAVTKIYLRYNSIVNKNLTKSGDVLVVEFNHVSCFAVVRKQHFSVSEDPRNIELYVILPSPDVFMKQGAPVTFYKLTNISNELSLLHSVYALQNAPLCQFIVSPRIHHYTKPNYLPSAASMKILDAMQFNALCNVIGSIQLLHNSMNLINGSPGTGKSFTLCCIVAEYIVTATERKKILISGPTDKIVCNLMNHFTRLRNDMLKDIELKCVIIESESESELKKTDAKVYKLHNILYPPNEKEFHKIKESLAEADIIFTTLLCCVKLQKLLKNNIFWGLVDDASSVYESEVLGIVSLNIQHLTLFGDMHRGPFAYPSYPHLYNSNDNGDLFSRICGVVSKWEQSIILFLNVQHRWNSEISEILDSMNFNTNNANLHVHFSFVSPIVKYCIFNLEESALSSSSSTAHIARMALAIHSIMSTVLENLTITVLVEDTTYLNGFKASLKLIDRSRKDVIKLSTVDDFQGLESDIIFYLQYNNNYNNLHKLLKIALTRAKHCLYLFFKYVHVKKKNVKFPWLKLIEDAKNKQLLKEIPEHIYQHPSASEIAKDPDIIKQLLVN